MTQVYSDRTHSIMLSNGSAETVAFLTLMGIKKKKNKTFCPFEYDLHCWVSQIYYSFGGDRIIFLDTFRHLSLFLKFKDFYRISQHGFFFLVILGRIEKGLWTCAYDTFFSRISLLSTTLGPVFHVECEQPRVLGFGWILPFFSTSSKTTSVFSNTINILDLLPSLRLCSWGASLQSPSKPLWGSWSHPALQVPTTSTHLQHGLCPFFAYAES